jgi:hypothetical protein
MGSSKSIGPFYGVRPETDIQILLESSDGVLFSVRNNVASQSQTIRKLMEEVGTERPILLAHVFKQYFTGCYQILHLPFTA